MKQENLRRGRGVGIACVLTLILLVLKLTGLVGICWGLVFAPLVLGVILRLLGVAVTLFAAWFLWRAKK